MSRILRYLKSRIAEFLVNVQKASPPTEIYATPAILHDTATVCSGVDSKCLEELDGFMHSLDTMVQITQRLQRTLPPGDGKDAFETLHCNLLHISERLNSVHHLAPILMTFSNKETMASFFLIITETAASLAKFWSNHRNPISRMLDFMLANKASDDGKAKIGYLVASSSLLFRLAIYCRSYLQVLSLQNHLPTPLNNALEKIKGCVEVIYTLDGEPQTIWSSLAQLEASISISKDTQRLNGQIIKENAIFTISEPSYKYRDPTLESPRLTFTLPHHNHILIHLRKLTHEFVHQKSRRHRKPFHKPPNTFENTELILLTDMILVVRVDGFTKTLVVEPIPVEADEQVVKWKRGSDTVLDLRIKEKRWLRVTSYGESENESLESFEKKFYETVIKRRSSTFSVSRDIVHTSNSIQCPCVARSKHIPITPPSDFFIDTAPTTPPSATPTTILILTPPPPTPTAAEQLTALAKLREMQRPAPTVKPMENVHPVSEVPKKKKKPLDPKKEKERLEKMKVKTDAKMVKAGVKLVKKGMEMAEAGTENSRRASVKLILTSENAEIEALMEKQKREKRMAKAGAKLTKKGLQMVDAGIQTLSDKASGSIKDENMKKTLGEITPKEGIKNITGVSADVNSEAINGGQEGAVDSKLDLALLECGKKIEAGKVECGKIVAELEVLEAKLGIFNRQCSVMMGRV